MSARTRQTPRGPAAGRFARPGTASRRNRATTHRAVPRPPMRLGRRPSQKTTDKALGRLKAVLPGSGAGTKKSGGGASGAKGKAGLAALAGATALAVVNRDKVTGLFSHDHSTATDTTPAGHPPTESPGDDPPSAA
jgi:hypothetical protein